MHAMKTRLDKLSRSVGCQNSYTRRLISWVNLRYDSPAKRSVYGGKPEQARWGRAAQGFDGALWRAAFVEESELQHFIADPAKFVARRTETALVFSDEVPFWIKIGFRKVAFADWETHGKGRRTTASQVSQMSQAPVDAAGDEMDTCGSRLNKAARVMNKEAQTRADENVTQRKGPRNQEMRGIE